MRAVSVPGLQQEVALSRQATDESTPSFAGRGPPATGGSPRQTPLLTMRSKRQPVAAGGNGLALVQAILGVRELNLCQRLRPLCSIPVPSQSGENAQFSGLRSRRGVFVRTVEPGWVRRRLGFWDPLFIAG